MAVFKSSQSLMRLDTFDYYFLEHLLLTSNHYAVRSPRNPERHMEVLQSVVPTKPPPAPTAGNVNDHF